MSLSITSSFGIDTGGARQYNRNFVDFDPNWKSARQKIQAKLLLSTEVRDKYGSVDEIDEDVFQC